MFISIGVQVVVSVMVVAIVLCVIGGVDPISAVIGVPISAVIVVTLGILWVFDRTVRSGFSSANAHPILFTTTLVIVWIGASQFF